MFDDTAPPELNCITKEMIKEEKSLEVKTDKEMRKQQRAFEAAQHENELKEQRYKLLLHLLDKSQFYVTFVKKKIEENIEKETIKKLKEKKISKRGNIASGSQDAEVLNRASKRMKIDPNAILVESNEGTKTSKCQEEGCEDTRLTPLGIEVPVDQPTFVEGCALRDYQMEGFKWLKMLFEGGINGILADEMGLGKTIETIAFLSYLYEKGILGPFLVVAPLSTLPNWLKEFQTCAPKIPVMIYHGPEKVRRGMKNQLTSVKNVGGQLMGPVVLTSYQVPIWDVNIMKAIPWKYLVIDEGHRLKNTQTQLFKSLQSFHAVNRLLLTGTPLQNNLKELWSLLHFLIPEIFDSYDIFQSWFDLEDIETFEKADKLIKQEKESKILSLLHEILSPFLLRRVKSDINLKLPGKKEVCVFCPLTDLQYELYKAFVDLYLARNKEKECVVIPDNPDGSRKKRSCTTYSIIKNGEKVLTYDTRERFAATEHEGGKPHINVNGCVFRLDSSLIALQVTLKKVANHPFLAAKPASDESGMTVDYIAASGKFLVLNELLRRLKDDGHKVLLFSTWTKILDYVEDLVEEKGYKYFRLDGNTSLDDRRESISQFNTDSDVFIFLLSTRAGGLGINLTSADTVIIFDSDWNPQADLQAQDRCHRIGQVKPVVVYRLISVGTIDEKVFTRQSTKRRLEKIIIQKGKFRDVDNRSIKCDVDLEELRESLMKNQHSMEIHPNGTVLSNEEWATLLDRSDLDTT